MNLIKGGSIAEKFCVEKSFPSNGESSKFEYVADLNGTESRQMMSSNDNTSPPNLAWTFKLQVWICDSAIAFQATQSREQHLTPPWSSQTIKQEHKLPIFIIIRRWATNSRMTAEI